MAQSPSVTASQGIPACGLAEYLPHHRAAKERTGQNKKATPRQKQTLALSQGSSAPHARRLSDSQTQTDAARHDEAMPPTEGQHTTSTGTLQPCPSRARWRHRLSTVSPPIVSPRGRKVSTDGHAALCFSWQLPIRPVWQHSSQEDPRQRAWDVALNGWSSHTMGRFRVSPEAIRAAQAAPSARLYNVHNLGNVISFGAMLLLLLLLCQAGVSTEYTMHAPQSHFCLDMTLAVQRRPCRERRFRMLLRVHIP